jgi:hypothetical protein
MKYNKLIEEILNEDENISEGVILSSDWKENAEEAVDLLYQSLSMFTTAYDQAEVEGIDLNDMKKGPLRDLEYVLKDVLKNGPGLKAFNFHRIDRKEILKKIKKA